MKTKLSSDKILIHETWSLDAMLKRLVDLIPQPLAVALQESTESALAQAWQEAERFDTPERAQARGQLFHLHAEHAFRLAGDRYGAHNESVETQPAGGHFSIVHLPGFVLGRARACSPGTLPRPGKTRRIMASANAWLSPLQLDFFRNITPPIPGTIYGVLTAVVGSWKAPGLAWLGVVIPSGDCESILCRASLQQIIDAHNTGGTVIVEDRARPTLKKRAKKNDDGDDA
ncbi:hypothetical protein [Oleispirillum naphthae]|uniref:hypothetical protein n=1 Tax=Oleispirillum naphthae TaxID=2838853 RepID=UPI00308245DB